MQADNGIRHLLAAPLLLNLITRRMWVIRFTSRPFYLQGKDSPTLWMGDCYSPRAGVDFLGNEKISFPARNQNDHDHIPFLHEKSFLFVTDLCTHTHTHMFVYILCVCVCVCVYSIWGAVGWGTVLQAGRSWCRFRMVSLEYFIDILPATLWSWSSLSL